MPPSTWASLVRLADAGATFHIVDTETTGLSPTGDRVIELATVSVRNGRIVDRFESFIDPGVKVPPRITQITGIRDAMLVGAPKPEVAFRQWRAFLGEGGHFVAHNARFDWDFLRAEFGRTELDWPFAKSICTVQLARHCLPQLRKHRLESLIAHFGIQVSARHRALADVEATAEIFLRCLAQLGHGPAAERPVPPPPVQDGWDTLVAFVRARSVPTAAMLDQHAAAAPPDADGAVVIRMTPIYKDRLDQEQRKMDLVQEAARAVYGAEVSVRLESRVGGA